MATTKFFSQAQTKRDKSAPNMTLMMSVIAAVLALVIGLSAVDIQRQHTADTSRTQAGAEDVSKFDGRGKWAGYM